ncbi:MAG: hypothetical protein GY820_15915 [Gammaproteobacteria bacterium]|nr:hypothetical protein [Gammaproteobacteria bacterium]
MSVQNFGSIDQLHHTWEGADWQLRTFSPPLAPPLRVVINQLQGNCFHKYRRYLRMAVQNVGSIDQSAHCHLLGKMPIFWWVLINIQHFYSDWSIVMKLCEKLSSTVDQLCAKSHSNSLIAIEMGDAENFSQGLSFQIVIS